MRELPRGTVTFLFTDIEGSTRLLREHGERYADLLGEHRRVLREAFASHGGVEVDTQGDAFFVAFPTAKGAIAAAAAAQAALASGPIRVRMGIHTGEPIVTDEGYVGMDVHRGARICAAGHGGQVLVSETTARLHEGAELRDQGLHRLKDLSAPQRLYQLGDCDFPPLKTLHGTNLPIQPTPFLGRERELAEVLGLLGGGDVRLLTLTGTGGSGKTRLALQAAAERLEDFPHGIWWVPLQTVTDPALVVPTIAQVVGGDDLARHMGDRRLLLLLDNMEQVLAAAPDLAALLAECPQLALLVTSREPLRLEAEQEYSVPPFAEAEAVGFFLARARATDPTFAANGAVRQICVRLDCLPLALELAAARVKLMSPERMLGRLDRALPLLTSGRRDAPARQRTLRATIEWSHELLVPEERQLFARLAVFAGGGTLEAAETICEADLDTLGSLVDKSLLRVEDDRFRMLETIREYAGERLEASEDSVHVRRRHAEWFLELAESADLAADSAGAQRHGVVEPEQDNLRAAIEWAEASDDIELAVRIAVALEGFWVARAPFEGARRLEALVQRADELEPSLRARVLRVAGGTTYIHGEFERGIAYHERSLGEYRRLGDEWGIAHMVHRLAVEAGRTGDDGRARELADESLVVNRRIGSLRGESQSLTTLGGVSFREGDHDRAFELLERAAALADESGFVWWSIGVRLTLAEYGLRAGRLDAARAWACQGLADAGAIEDRLRTVCGLGCLAWHAAATGLAERAGTLWGAIETEESRGPIGHWEGERGEYVAQLEAVRGPEFDEGSARGRRFSLDEAVRYALDPRGGGNS